VQQGRTDSLGKVKRIMRAEGIYACPPHRYQVLRETGSLETKNLLVDLEITHINQVWYADITYIYTQEGWLYLAAILDAYSKRVVGYAMAETMQTDLIIQALRMAVKQRQPAEGLIHHSDRGSQYTSYAFQGELSAWSMTASFTGTGACLDNAYIESFFATLKKELLYARASSFSTRQEARTAIFDYIYAFYNRQRLHSSLAYTSPEYFERSLDNLEKLAA
jgi:putative transposase